MKTLRTHLDSETRKKDMAKKIHEEIVKVNQTINKPLVFEKTYKFCTSVEQAHKMIDTAIEVLLEQKRKITDKNFHHYNIHAGHEREIDPIITIPGIGCPNGFRQIGPDRYTIIVESTENLGRTTVSSKGIWDVPKEQDIKAISDHLESIRHKKHRKRPKGKRIK